MRRARELSAARLVPGKNFVSLAGAGGLTQDNTLEAVDAM